MLTHRPCCGPTSTTESGTASTIAYLVRWIIGLRYSTIFCWLRQPKGAIENSGFFLWAGNSFFLFFFPLTIDRRSYQ